jgi:antitoxin component YwqK of YwqJK toxin-antitoxin module
MRYVYALLMISFLGCFTSKNDGQENSESTDSTKVIRNKYPSGKIKSEARYKNGKKNGMARSYDKNGALSLELPYVDDKREGQSKRYYEGGKVLYQTTEYKNDLLHGIQVKYREDGSVMSEARYEKDFPCLGIREYYTDKTLKREYPQIMVKPIDKLETSGKYILEISMSDKVRRVRYYQGKLPPSGCLSEDLYHIYQEEGRKTGILEFELPPGAFMMKEVSLIAAVETIYDNTFITQTTYNLAIQY